MSAVEILSYCSHQAGWPDIVYLRLISFEQRPQEPVAYFRPIYTLRRQSNSKDSGTDITRTASFDMKEIITTTEQSNARVVFIDPLANNAQLSTTDVRQLAETVVFSQVGSNVSL